MDRYRVTLPLILTEIRRPFRQGAGLLLYRVGHRALAGSTRREYSCHGSARFYASDDSCHPATMTTANNALPRELSAISHAGTKEPGG